MIVAPGDQIRVSAKDVTQLDAAYVAQPVTSGLTGTLNIRNWESDELESGPHNLANSASADDWFVDVAAPTDKGRYRLVVVLSKGGAQRTLHGVIDVQDPST